jgi:hypothetical protein
MRVIFVSIPFASSTVTAPSLPTMSMASAMILPISGSLPAATVATYSMSCLPETGFADFSRSFCTASTARAMPR